VKITCATTAIALKNVLLATDFSPVSESALRFAAVIARRYGSKLWVTNVISPAETALVPPEYWGSSQQLIEEAAERQLQAVGTKLQGVPHKLLLKHGGISEAIFDEIARLGIDLLIVGSHGREGFERLLMGSVAEETFRRVTCPVLTVGPRATVPTADEVEFREIVFATNFGPASLAAAPYAISLAQDFQARLTLLNVVTELTDWQIDPGLVIQERTNRLRKLIPADVESWCKPECEVEFGSTAEGILRVAQERSADLIVLGAKCDSGHTGAATHLVSATAHTVVSHAVCPVMTVHT